MPAVFVTATGTEIGKTFVTAGLAAHLHRHGRSVAILKPVLSGFSPETFTESDPAVLLRAVGEVPSLAAIESVAPWRFAAPLSPDMAAQREGKAIDFSSLLAFCKTAVDAAADVLLIEGIGGLMVPFTRKETVLDLMAALPIRAVLVAGTYVGTLSHTLTALAALHQRGIDLGAIVLNETPDSAASPEETAASLMPFTTAPIIIVRCEVRCGAGGANAASFAQLAHHLLGCGRTHDGREGLE